MRDDDRLLTGARIDPDDETRVRALLARMGDTADVLAMLFPSDAPEPKVRAVRGRALSSRSKAKGAQA